MVELSDIALVTQVAVFRNKNAFDQLVRKYQSPVRRFFLNQTAGDEQLSDDLAQETFIKAYVNITKFRGMSSFSTWLMRIAYNVFYDEVRKRKVETVSFEEGGRRLLSSTNIPAEFISAAGLFSYFSPLISEDGHLLRTGPAEARRADVYHAATHRRLSHRPDQQDHWHRGEYGEVALETRKGKISKLFKRKRL